MNLIVITIICCCFFSSLLLFLVVLLIRKLKSDKLKKKNITYFSSNLMVNNVAFTTETTKNTSDFVEKYFRKIIMVETIEKLINRGSKGNTLTEEQPSKVNAIFTNIFEQDHHHSHHHHKDSSIFFNHLAKERPNLHQPKHTLLNDVIGFLPYLKAVLMPLHINKNLVNDNFEKFNGVVKKVGIIATVKTTINITPTDNFDKEKTNDVPPRPSAPKINSYSL